MKKESKTNPKEIRKTLRFSDEDYSVIEKRMNEFGIKTFTEYATTAIMRRRLFSNDEKELTKTINKFGVLYNQHVSLLHQGKVPNNLETIRLLERIANSLEELTPK